MGVGLCEFESHRPHKEAASSDAASFPHLEKVIVKNRRNAITLQENRRPAAFWSSGYSIGATKLYNLDHPPVRGTSAGTWIIAVRTGASRN